MDPATTHIETILAAAVEIAEAAARRAYIEQACAGDAELKRRVDQMVEDYFRAGSFLESPAAEIPAPNWNAGPKEKDGPTLDEPIAERPGTVIGPYKLLDQIGEGGFGFVFVAEQTHPVRRKVALKVLKPGMDTRQVVARFEAERQALALMDHPNIAKFFDAGVTGEEPRTSLSGSKSPLANVRGSGRPFFVMELVRGVPITEHCDQYHLAPRQRLELLMSVCQAVQHAHQKGIIHRDLKPSNILVTANDATPVVKVIDFGVAKALGHELTDMTLFTGFAQMIGTPLYMSPEQAGQSALDIDTRSDIYSLGVLLYELLTGTTPFTKDRFKKAAYDEIRRIIREEEPPKPSTRLSQLGKSGEPTPTGGAAQSARRAEPTSSLASVSALRQMEPAKLTTLVRGELDWIVMKCLEKDRNRRYETANGLARDIERYLHDEPVAAGPPSAGYRVRKFVRRHRGKLTVAAAMLALLLTATTVSMLLALWAWQAEKDASDERNAANTARDKEAEERVKATTAQAKAEAALFRSLVNQARALQLSRQEGWRVEALDILRRAAALDTPERNFPELRGEAVACLSELDARKIVASPAGASSDETATGGVTNSAIFWSIDFSHDGKYLAAADYLGKSKCWKVVPGGLELHCEFVDPDAARDGMFQARAPMPAVRFHPDNKKLAYSAWNRSFQWLSLDKAEPPSRWLASGAQPRTIAFDRIGRRAAVSWIDGRVEVHDLSSGKCIRTFQSLGANGSFQWMPVALSPDGKTLVTVAPAIAPTIAVQAHGVDETKPAILLGRHQHGIRTLSFSRDGRAVVSASWDGTAKIWDLPEGNEPIGKERVILLGHTNRVNGAVFSPDGELVATVSDDRTARLWDARTGQLLLVMRLPTVGRSVAFHPNGTLLAVGHSAVSLYELSSRRERRRLIGHHYYVAGLAFHPRRPLLASSSADGNIRIWDLESGQSLKKFPGNSGKGLRNVIYSPSGNWLAAGFSGFFNVQSTDTAVRIWDATSGQVRKLLHGHNADVSSVAFNPSGQRLAAAGDDGLILVWDTADGKEIVRLNKSRESAPRLDFVSETELVIGDSKTGIEIVDARTGAILRSAPVAGGIRDFALAPAKDRLFVIGNDGAIRMFTLPDLQPDVVVRGVHAGRALTAAVSPDGRWVASVGVDRRVALWNAQTQQEIVSLPPQNGNVASMAFEPKGTRLAICGVEEQVTLWDLAQVRTELGDIGLAWEEPPAAHNATQRASVPPPADLLFDDVWPALDRNDLTRAAELLEQLRARERAALKIDPRDWPGRESLTEAYRRYAEAALKQGKYAAVADTVIERARSYADGWRECHWAANYLFRSLQMAFNDKRLSAAERQAIVQKCQGARDLVREAIQRGAKVIPGALEAETLPIVANNSSTSLQWMDKWGADRWSNGYQLHCNGVKGQFVELAASLSAQGDYGLTVQFTKASNFGIVEVSIDDKKIGKPFDSYGPIVAPSGEIDFGIVSLSAGTHRVKFMVVDKNPKANAYSMGIDYLRFESGEIVLALAKKNVEAAQQRAAAEPKNAATRHNLWTALYALGDAHERAGDGAAAKQQYARAEAELDRIAADATDPFDVWWRAVVFHQGRFQWELVVQKCEKALTVRPGNYWAMQLRGFAHAELGNYDKATPIFAEAEKAKDANEWAFENRARLSLLSGDLEAYRTGCAATLQRFPDSIWAPYYYALGSDSGIDAAQIVTLADQAVQKAPANYLSRVAAGSARYRAGEYAEAVKRLTNAAANIPEGNGPQVWFFLAMAVHRLDQTDEARQWLAKAVAWQERLLQEHPRDPSAMRWYTRVEMEVLRREAEALILAKSAPAPKKESKPEK